MSGSAVRISLNQDDFRRLVRGETVTRLECLDAPAVQISLLDIGFQAMLAEVRSAAVIDGATSESEQIDRRVADIERRAEEIKALQSAISILRNAATAWRASGRDSLADHDEIMADRLERILASMREAG